jgi:NAD(P)-dependent dehydrogenase (short-subunit alcohol dehydrogenase family)
MNYEKLFRLDNRVALVIGAASGIGEAAAHGLAAHGARVVCADLQLDAAQAVADVLPAASAMQVDVTDAASVDQCLQTVVQEHGSLDIVVTTPGINVRKPLIEYADDEFERVMAVNLKGTFHVLRAAGNCMTRHYTGTSSSSIIAISSIRSQTVEPGQGVYAATKAGIVQLVRAAAAELGAHGIRVNAIAPGVVETPLTAPIKNRSAWYEAYANKSILKRWAQASEMAGAILFLSSDAASYVTGSLLFVDGGWTAADGRFDP